MKRIFVRAVERPAGETGEVAAILDLVRGRLTRRVAGEPFLARLQELLRPTVVQVLISRAGMVTTFTAKFCAAAAAEAARRWEEMLSGLSMMVTRLTRGAISLSSSSNFAPMLGSKTVKPVKGERVMNNFAPEQVARTHQACDFIIATASASVSVAAAGAFRVASEQQPKPVRCDGTQSKGLPHSTLR